MIRLRRLNKNGISRFQDFIDSQQTTDPEPFDVKLLLDPRLAEIAGDGPEVSAAIDFADRFDAGQAVDAIIEKSKLTDPALDVGVWCWLSWFWFENLCPLARSGRRATKGSERWILSLSYDRYYRHLLAGPWWIYRAHRDDPERARSLLCTPVNKPGELVGQIAASQELVSNPGLVAMITKLYYDSDSGKLKRGHGSKIRGGARRLVRVVNQLDMIWDLYSTRADQFLSLLPKEFDRFQPA